MQNDQGIGSRYSRYSEEIHAAVADGRIPEAIEMLREQHGLSRREARREAEQLERAMRGTRIDQHPVVAEQGGAKNLAWIVLIVAVLVVGYLFVLPRLTG